MNKNLVVSLFAASVFALAGCSTPTQQAALAQAAVGNAVATYYLDREGPAAVKGLTDLAAILPGIPLGKVSAYQLGAVNAELKAIQVDLQEQQAIGQTSVGTGKMQVSLSNVVDQLGSFTALVAQANAGNSGGVPTAEMSILSGNLADVAAGITNAIQYYQGGQSVLPSTPVSP